MESQSELFESGKIELLPYDGSAILNPNVFSDIESGSLFERLVSDLDWQEHTLNIFGRLIKQPRLTAWYGDPGRSYEYSGLLLHPLRWTQDLITIKETCEKLTGHQFNSVLANLYRNGKDSVAWHADDENELGSEPIIASVNLGNRRRFDLRHRESGKIVRCEMPVGSVLVMSGLSQSCWLHQVPKTAKNVGPRINLTYRWIHQ